MLWRVLNLMREDDVSDVKEPEDIRSEPYTFEELGIRQISRIALLSQKALGEKGINQKYSLLLLEGALVAFAAVLPVVAAKESVKQFKIKLKKDYLEEVDTRLIYYNRLMEWFELLIAEFYKISNVVSGKDVDIYFTGTDEPRKEKVVKE